jgi:hypothetical protein
LPIWKKGAIILVRRHSVCAPRFSDLEKEIGRKRAAWSLLAAWASAKIERTKQELVLLLSDYD